jgi:hypothetical protein
MTVLCNRTGCGKFFDDAERSTICPHPLIMPREDLDRKIAAIELLGKCVRFALSPESGPFYRVESINFIGMLSLAGMAGEFAPHLFVVRD